MTTSTFVVGSLCGLVLVGIYVWIVVALHMAYTKKGMMLKLLRNCSADMGRIQLEHGGPMGKLRFIGEISGAATFPAFYLKHGGVAIDSLEHFPMPLKRKLIILHLSFMGLLVSLALFVALSEIIKAYNI